MDAKTLRLLIVLNIVLVVGLVVVGYLPGTVSAQLGGKGDYMLVSGDVTGRPDLDAIYILQVSQQRLAVLTFDTRNGKLEEIAVRDISSDAHGGSAR